MKNAIGMILAVVMAIACMCFVQAAAAEQTEVELLGGWERPESPEITEEIQTLCDKGFEGMTGVSYTPAALLSTQVVAGTNYAIVCEAAVVSPDAVSCYAIVYVNEALDGTAALLDIVILRGKTPPPALRFVKQAERPPGALLPGA